jgi:ankyrin repeat protein
MPTQFPTLYHDIALQFEKTAQQKGLPNTESLSFKEKQLEIRAWCQPWSLDKQRDVFLQLFADLQGYFTQGLGVVLEGDLFDYPVAIELFLGLSALPLTKAVVYGKEVIDGQTNFTKELGCTLNALVIFDGALKASAEVSSVSKRVQNQRLIAGFYRLIYALSTEKALQESALGRLKGLAQPALIQQLIKQQWQHFLPTLQQAMPQQPQLPQLGNAASLLRQESWVHLMMRLPPKSLPVHVQGWLMRQLQSEPYLTTVSSVLGQTPLHAAIYAKHSEWLIRTDKQLVLGADALGLTPLHVAVMLGDVEAVKACWPAVNYGQDIETYKEGVVIQTSEDDCRSYPTHILQQTALHLVFNTSLLLPSALQESRQQARVSVLQALLHHPVSAALLEARDAWGLTVLQYALMTKDAALICPLIQAGADVNAVWPEVFSLPPATPPKTERQYAWGEEALTLFPSFAGRMGEGSTALHYACQSPFMPLSVIRLLLLTSFRSQGPLKTTATNTQTPEGQTALEALVLTGCSLLYRYGAESPQAASQYVRWLLLVMKEIQVHQGLAIRKALQVDGKEKLLSLSPFWGEESALSAERRAVLEGVFAAPQTVSAHLEALQAHLAEPAQRHPQGADLQEPLACLIEQWQGWLSDPEPCLALVSASNTGSVNPVPKGEPITIGRKRLPKTMFSSALDTTSLPLMSISRQSSNIPDFIKQRADCLVAQCGATSEQLSKTKVPNYQAILNQFISQQSEAVQAYCRHLSTRLIAQLLGSFVALGTALQANHNTTYDKVINFITKASRAFPVVLGIFHMVGHISVALVELGLELIKLAFEGWHVTEFLLASKPGIEHRVREWFTGQHAHFSQLTGLLQGREDSMLNAASLLGEGLAAHFTLLWGHTINQLSVKQAEVFAEDTFQRFLRVTKKTTLPEPRPQAYVPYLLNAMLTPQSDPSGSKVILSKKKARQQGKAPHRWTSTGLLRRSWVILFGDQGQPLVFALGQKNGTGNWQVDPKADKYAKKYGGRLGHSGSILPGWVPVPQSRWGKHAEVEKAVAYYQRQRQQLEQSFALEAPLSPALPAKAAPDVKANVSVPVPIGAIADDESFRFYHQKIEDKGNCGFDALGISRETFVNTFYEENQLRLKPAQLEKMVIGILLALHGDYLEAGSELNVWEDAPSSILGFLGKVAVSLQKELKEEIGALIQEPATEREETFLDKVMVYLQRKREENPGWQQALCQAYLQCLCYQPENPQGPRCWLSKMDMALYGDLTNRSIVIWGKTKPDSIDTPFLVSRDKDHSFDCANSKHPPLHVLFNSRHFDRLDAILPEAANYYTHKLEDKVKVLSQSVGKLTDKVKRLKEKSKKKKATTASRDGSLAQDVSVPPVSPENSTVHELPVSEPRLDLEEEPQSLPVPPQQIDFVSRFEYEGKIKGLQTEVKNLEEAYKKEIKELKDSIKILLERPSNVESTSGATNPPVAVLIQHSVVCNSPRKRGVPVVIPVPIKDTANSRQNQ